MKRCVDYLYGMRYYALWFYDICREEEGFPTELAEALKRALIRGRGNEILMMADAMTDTAAILNNAYRLERPRALTRQRRYELICVAAASLYRQRDVLPDPKMVVTLSADIERYENDHGDKDLAFLKSYIDKQTETIISAMKKKEEEAVVNYIKRMERIRKEEEEWRSSQRVKKVEEQENRKDLEAEREKQRLAEQERLRQEDLRRQQELEKRKAEIERFKALPLDEKLKTVVSGDKTPSYYSMDYSRISEQDLKSVQRATLVKVITTFTTVKDKGWKVLQTKAKMVLSE